MVDYIKILKNQKTELDQLFFDLRENFTEIKRENINKKCNDLESSLEYYTSPRHNIGHRQLFESMKKDIETYKLIANNINEDFGFKVSEVRSIFANRLKSIVFANLKFITPREFFDACRETVLDYIRNSLELHVSVKISIVFTGFFTLLNTEKIEKYFSTKFEVLLRTSDLTTFYESSKDKMLTLLQEFQGEKSGWSLDQILSIQLIIAKYTPLKVGNYILLPCWIRRKAKSVLNINSEQNSCFLYCLAAFLKPAKNNPSDPKSYNLRELKLNFSGIGDESGKGLFTFKDIEKFEKLNPISINVFIIEKKNLILPTYITKNEREKHMNLLLINRLGDSHFCLITDLSRLVSGQINRKHGKKYICNSCLNFFYTEEKLKKHKIICKELNKCAIKLPDKSNNIMKFKNHYKKLKNYFVLYLDLESILRPVENVTEIMNAYQQHECFAIGYYLQSSYDCPLSGYQSYEGPDCARWLANELENIAFEVNSVSKNKKLNNTFHIF